MRAIQVTRLGGPEVLETTEVPDPEPAPGELLVRTDAIGVNFIDVYFRTGAYATDLPYTPGSEATGTVVAMADGVTGFSVGDRVAWASAPGSYAELVRVPVSGAVPVPAEVTAPVAASALLQGMTAHYLITSVYPVKRGDTVLVHAGAGGVGLKLTQLAVQRGARVISTVSTADKEALSREAGASEVLRYSADLAGRVRDLTSGEGVAAVYDGVGKDTFDASLECVRVRGTVALFGAASGPVPPFDPQRLNRAGSVFLARPSLAHFVRTRDELLWRAGDVFDAISSRALVVRVGAEYPLERAADAHRDLEGRRTTGSVVLLPK
ncbi:quinone oxidoreductase family protein [Hoyosella subflava]|uniref:Putative quinone oxidoreductase n=1 Tax=Hoyosella subflava (strain DSM 45089 / JCM 17490 / NBRC 109087 / DQS3-9A1) TaxID=443218 RepID=F6EMI6_HOYSD|nr:quinone oxidoreductase [Hoyosella subflava]AEF40346.1 Putative quinone oxidoreductase [Hoyosella subflava DQS3-9A1]